MAKNILVTGANGQLGSEIRQRIADYPSFTFFFTDVDTLDMTDKEDVQRFFDASRVDYVINCAAYTAVDQAEDEVEKAFLINRDAVAALAQAAQQSGAKVIHVSTDYVFEGTSQTPYKESDATAPQSVYGKSKLEGEQALRQYCPQSIVVRTAWLYSSFGNNFVKTMLRLGRERDSLAVVSDQKGTPTYAGDLAKALLDIIVWVEAKELLPVGIFHYTNLGETTWYEFARRIHQLAGIDRCNLSPVTTADYPTKARRPAYSLLSKEKIQQTFQLHIPDWEDSLRKCIALIEKQ